MQDEKSDKKVVWESKYFLILLGFYTFEQIPAHRGNKHAYTTNVVGKSCFKSPNY
jgi:hypothetical protein